MLTASAFLVLAAEPLYLLVDTAVVGHLGVRALGALGIGTTLMALLAIVGTFVEYGTTSRAARWFGQGQRERAVDEGLQASYLAVGIGLVVVAVGQLCAGPLVRVMTGSSSTLSGPAETWFRVALCGMPMVLLVLAAATPVAASATAAVHAATISLRLLRPPDFTRPDFTQLNLIARIEPPCSRARPAGHSGPPCHRL